MKPNHQRSHSAEIPVYRIQRGQSWQSLLLTGLFDVILLIAIFLLFNYLSRTVVDSYIRTANFLGRAEFMVLNLFLGVVPLLTVLALAQDFIFTFFIHLELTERRVTGRIPGLLWVKDINIPLDQIALMKLTAGRLEIQEYGGRKLLVRGLPNLEGLLDAYRHVRLGTGGLAADLLDPLPDAFTFEKARL